VPTPVAPPPSSRPGDPEDDSNDGDGCIHVYPLFDGREHICDGLTCWCGPRADDEEPLVIIHNVLQ
jgi:hypothetical protein